MGGEENGREMGVVIKGLHGDPCGDGMFCNNIDILVVILYYNSARCSKWGKLGVLGFSKETEPIVYIDRYKYRYRH